jgi:hypothetical protein
MPIFFIGLIALGVGIFAVWILIKALQKKKRKRESYQKVIQNPGYVKASSTPVQTPQITAYDKQKFDKFISEYDDGSLKFPDVNFRKGAAITCKFGLAEGYRMQDGNMVWGYVRMHSGVDRARGEEYKGIKDIVMCPFDFQRTMLTDYGDTGYGALIQLFQDEYEFEFRIGHMNPKTDIIAWSLDQIKKCKPFQRNWFFGKAGTYGDSTGEHTHTEILSYDERCEVFEILLEELYGDSVYKEYSTGQILSFYKKQTHFEKATDRVILDDWAQIKKIKKVVFANKYLFRYIDWDGKSRTRYSTELLFNGL